MSRVRRAGVRPVARPLVESVEYIPDCLVNNVGTTEVEGYVPDVFDEPVLAIPKESAHVV